MGIITNEEVSLIKMIVSIGMFCTTVIGFIGGLFVALILAGI